MPEEENRTAPETTEQPSQQTHSADAGDYGKEMEQKLDERLKHFQNQQQQQVQQQDS